MNNTNLKTELKSYYFDIGNKSGLKEYNKLKSMLEMQGLKCFETWGNGSHYLPFAKNGVPVELETNHIFDNQWNTAPIEGHSDKGLRVFDWAQDYPANMSKNIKKGHYLVVSDEMRAIRDNTNACGYCGHQEAEQKGNVFCPKCIGSEYLKESQIYLLRMLPVSSKESRAPLTTAESENLLPLYISAQTIGAETPAGKKKANQYADIKEKAKKAIKSAEIERDGMLWLMDNGVNIDNCIYYNHTNKFSFGWRSHVSKSVESKLFDILVAFPFEYEIKAESTLQS